MIKKSILHNEFAFKALITVNDDRFLKFFESQYFRDSMKYLNRKCVEYTVTDRAKKK